MNRLVGQIREKTGRSVWKAYLVREVSHGSRVLPLMKPDAKTPYVPSVIDKKPLRIWYIIAGKYFSPNEQFWKHGKDRTYELHLENMSLAKGETKATYINFDSGAPVGLDEIQAVVYPPQVLFKLFATEHVKAAVQSAKGMNTGLVLGIILFSFGLVVGLLIGMNTGIFTGGGGGGA